MRVGHEPQMRVCNTTNPSTELVRGVLVGHFGGETEAARCAEPRPDERRPGASGASANVLAELGLGEATEGRELTEREIVLSAEFASQFQALVGIQPAGAVLSEK